MATEAQRNYISDLAVIKTKEFKEVKELLSANNIGGEIVAAAQTIAEITDALTDKQASRAIDALLVTQTPERGRVYSKKRVERTVAGLEDIKATVDGWRFPE